MYIVISIMKLWQFYDIFFLFSGKLIHFPSSESKQPCGGGGGGFVSLKMRNCFYGDLWRFYVNVIAKITKKMVQPTWTVDKWEKGDPQNG